MRITSKGQVTIPKTLREELGIVSGSIVNFTRDGDSIRITKASEDQDRGDSIVAHLRGRGDVEMTTDEIMALTRNE